MKDIKRRKMVIITIMSLIILGLLVTLSVNVLPAPKEVKELADTYFQNIVEKKEDESLKLVYMKEDNKSFLKLIGISMKEDTLYAYKVKNIKRMNDKLYEIETFMNSQKYGEHQVKNYIAYIEGSWHFVINKRDVPENLYIFPITQDTEQDLTDNIAQPS